MRRAVEHLRTGGEVGDERAVREATARLLDRLADRELDVYTHGDAANLADRILAAPPGRMFEDAKPLPAGYDNGQPSSRLGREQRD